MMVVVGGGQCIKWGGDGGIQLERNSRNGNIEVKKINNEERKQRKEESSKKNNWRKKGMNYGRLRIET